MKQAVGLITLLLGAQAGYASLILTSPNPVSGTGLGTEPTLLTVQSNGSATTETGCVGATTAQIGAAVSAAGLCTGSSADVKTGAGQIGPQTLASAGITVASDFGIVFNADQSASGPITLTNLAASFYSSTGTFLYQTSGVLCPSLGATCTFPNTFSGVGKSGFLFTLDAAQRTAATAAGAFSNTNNRVGLSATLTNTNGGPETFYLATLATGGGGGGAVPEPTTMLLTGGGLLALGMVSRRKIVR